MEAEEDLTDRAIRLSTSAEKPFVRSPLWIASKREGGEFQASSETFQILVGSPDPREEEAVVVDPRVSQTDPEAKKGVINVRRQE